jgi:hypothetical protein
MRSSRGPQSRIVDGSAEAYHARKRHGRQRLTAAWFRINGKMGYGLTDAGRKSRPIRTPLGVEVGADFVDHPVSGALINSDQRL